MGEQRFIPETPAEIDAAWLSGVLQRDVKTVQYAFLGEGVGFMGEVLKLTVTFADTSQQVLVAKIPKKENRTSGELLGVYERESMFFETLASSTPVRLPALIYGDFDRDRGSENQREILASMDKLPLWLARLATHAGKFVVARKQRRYVLLIEYLDMLPGDQLAGLGAERASLVLSSFAAVHRHYWQMPTLDEHFWLLPLNIDARLRHSMYLQHVEAFRKEVAVDFGDSLDWLRNHGETLSRRFTEDAPNTLLHCDLRLDNVVFDGDSCAFIDWQLVRKGPAAYDVAYFLSSALHSDVRDVSSILQTYHQALGVPDYTFALFRADYERALLVILSSLSTVAEVDVGDGRGAQIMAKWFERLAARIAEVDLNAEHFAALERKAG